MHRKKNDRGDKGKNVQGRTKVKRDERWRWKKVRRLSIGWDEQEKWGGISEKDKRCEKGDGDKEGARSVLPEGLRLLCSCRNCANCDSALLYSFKMLSLLFMQQIYHILEE